MENKEHDRQLYKEARRRVEFKSHAVTYLLVNAFLWAIWLFTGARTGGFVPWPVFATVGWGIGLGTHYFNAYHGNQSMVDREYEKLKKKKGH